MGTRIHLNTSYEPLTTCLRRTMRSGQVYKNVKKIKKNEKKKGKKIDTGGDNFIYRGHVPAERTKTNLA